MASWQRVDIVEILLPELRRACLLDEALKATDAKFGMTALMWACLHNNRQV
jgi:hypothetical protein